MDNKTKILFIDDELDIICPLAYWFNSQGYPSSTACNNEEALKILKEEAPDIVFLDIHMPNIDGFAVLKNIRSINQAIPVILMSASCVEESIEEKGGEHDVAGVFYKGDDFSKALKLIKTILNKDK